MKFGSIPACAGEPVAVPAWPRPSGVYPRVCGGTEWSLVNTAFRWGLSPRVRGNRVRHHHRRPASGSIPACAGEPSPQSGKRHRDAVYPRVCGGT